MKWTVAVASLAIFLITPAAEAAPRASVEKSPDVLRPQHAKKSGARLLAPLAAGGVAAAAAPTVDDVGDADSFGRNVTYIGMTQTDSVTLSPDCTGSDPEVERCIIANPAPAPTSFNESDLAIINLPV